MMWLRKRFLLSFILVPFCGLPPRACSEVSLVVGQHDEFSPGVVAYNMTPLDLTTSIFAALHCKCYDSDGSDDDTCGYDGASMKD